MFLFQDLSENVSACIANLDMILRWLTIRFFDTNPSVIMKAMDYLQQVFSYLSDEDYHLLDYEAYSFLPFLIMKVNKVYQNHYLNCIFLLTPKQQHNTYIERAIILM